ncbi:origin recognition complex, subunit 4 [Backusella circina FSU 941]|nr:origin recognition complex, subunit 4 [Backusella circina FSU 941]
MTKRANLEEVPSQKRTKTSRESDISDARSFLLSQLTEKAIPKHLFGLDKEYNKLYALLKQTVTAGESNSCLLFGNRGTGKTSLIRRVLEDLTHLKKEFLVVKLNGLTETNDRLALQEIAKQLVTDKDQPDRSFTSFAESFDYILSLLKSGNRTSLPVIFLLDEFDLFAQHPKQALLYNLFDAAQSAQNPLAVVGSTCRLDTMDLLEKRVKSRFSHRQLYLFPPASFGDFVQVTKSKLLLDTDTDYANEFNASVEQLYQSPVLLDILRRIFDLTKDIRLFYRLFLEPVSLLSLQTPFLDLESITQSNISQRADSKTELLKGITLLELVMIISMKKLMEKDVIVFNFSMIYDEYKDFMNRTQVRGMGFGMKLYKQAVALKAFENLQMFELVCPTDKTGGKCPKEYRMMRLMMEEAQVTELVLKYNCPSMVKKWGTNGA